MKKVLVSIKNELLSTAVIRALRDCGAFLPCQMPSDKSAPTDADILLVEISYLPGATMESRMKEISHLRKQKPECKIVAFCDDNAAPELARKVTRLKKDQLIDGFLYTSVTASYLLSTLASL